MSSKNSNQSRIIVEIWRAGGGMLKYKVWKNGKSATKESEPDMPGIVMANVVDLIEQELLHG